MRALTLEQAKAQFPHRYTVDHVPAHATRPVHLVKGEAPKYYAPQYASDAQWYESTQFPGEEGMPKRGRWCKSNNPTWPMGVWLDAPLKPGV